MYKLNLINVSKKIYSGHLKMGGKSPKGDDITFTNYYMEMNGRPFFGIAGEYHFTRYPYLQWDEEIAKIKMGGINIVTTYIFWNHHEEEEGLFDWTGDKNLRYFVDLCSKHGMYVILRIGPFCHGECRNGGLPDWLYGRPFEVRSNDEGYLYYVKRLYNEISRQVAGRMYKDGGPVIAIQLENEFQCCGAPWEMDYSKDGHRCNSGTGGVEHLKTLKKLAIEAGMTAPFYTITGWGGPIIEDETLPMQGGYAFYPWNDMEDYVHPVTENYVFLNYHEAIGETREYHPRYEPSRYPFSCCEMGGGIQITYVHRPIVPSVSVEAMTLQKIAGGCNFIGYYVYHGGSNPIGKHAYMHEYKNPMISYDFQAPIREYGQITELYKRLKALFMFFKDFGGYLAPMATVLPEDERLTVPEYTGGVRYAARVKDNAGFLFLNNYQDHVEMKDHEDVKISLKFEEETITIPNERGFTLKKGVCAMLPFNMELDGVLLKYSTTRLITKIVYDDFHYYFFSAIEGIAPEYSFDSNSLRNIEVRNGSVVEVKGRVYVSVYPGNYSVIDMNVSDGRKIKVVTLTAEQALNCWKLDLWGSERVILSDSNIISDDNHIQLYNIGSEDMTMSIFPDVEGILSTPFERLQGIQNGIFTEYSIKVPKKEIELKVNQIRSANDPSAKVVLSFPDDILEGVNEVFLKIDYIGDTGNAFIDGRLVNDNFYNGTTWEIGLRRFLPKVLEKGMYLYIRPLRKGSFVQKNTAMFYEQEFVGDQLAKVFSVKAVPEYKVNVAISDHH